MSLERRFRPDSWKNSIKFAAKRPSPGLLAAGMLSIALAACGGADATPAFQAEALVGLVQDTANPGIGSDNYFPPNSPSYLHGNPQNRIIVSKNEFFYAGCFAKPPEGSQGIRSLTLKINGQVVKSEYDIEPGDHASTLYQTLRASEYQEREHNVECETDTYNNGTIRSKAAFRVLRVGEETSLY